MHSWFPIAKGLINEESFRILTPAEKIYFFQVLSDYNLNGQYYKSDIQYAATLNLSVDKIRKARAKLAKVGYIDMIPGTRDKRGRGLATTYKGVKWHDVPEDEQFSKMSRSAFEGAVDEIRDGVFTHEDVACFVYIDHLVYVKGGEYAILTKSEFCTITNMPKAMERVKSLFNKFQFSDGSRLFKYDDAYHTIKFKELGGMAFDPEHVKIRNKQIDLRVKAIQAKEAEKEKAKSRQEGDIFAEDLLPLFKQLYTEKHGKSPVIGNNQYEQKLAALGDPVRVARAINNYFICELPQGFKNYSIHTFITNAERYMY